MTFDPHIDASNEAEESSHETETLISYNDQTPDEVPVKFIRGNNILLL